VQCLVSLQDQVKEVDHALCSSMTTESGSEHRDSSNTKFGCVEE
jgi:hypothetical protein